MSKDSTHASVVAPPIYDTAPLVVPALAPGEAVVIQIPWYPPNPADFACFGGDQGHFCLLARVETSTTAPFGMSSPETTDVYANTRNNNNIAWKNITVVDNFPGVLRLSSVLVRNVFDQTVQAGFRFANARDAASFLNFGDIFVDLKPELFRRWRAGGGAGQGIRVVGGGTAGNEVLQITSPEAFIQNIRLDPNEVFSVDIRFALYPPIVGPMLQEELFNRLQQAGIPKWDLIQFGAPGNPNAIVGGQRFEVDFRKLVLVKGGSDWRYLDDGSNPGPSWFSTTFNDSAWKLGKSELGFGDNPATTINGGPADRRNITTYFRREFTVADPSFLQSLLLRLKRDDGAVVYLNGTEVHRVNMPGGAVAPTTLATREVGGVEEEVFFPASVALSLLKPGRNVLAVEVHQNSARSEDLSFDLELCANPMSTRFAPSVAFASPANGALFQTGQAISVEVQALDSDGQITSVSLFADGNPVGTDSQVPFTFQLSGAALGSHLLRAVATDNDSLQSTVDLTVTVLDNTPPNVTLTEPVADTDFPANQAIRFSATAADPGGAVERVEFYVRDAELFVTPVTLLGTVTASPYTLLARNLAPGHYMGVAVAIDNRGARGQSTPVHFDVEGAADSGNCNTICFRSSQYYLLNPVSLPPGSGVQIGGVNSNAPTRNQTAIRFALQGGPNPLQQLNQQFVAAQLSLIRAGGHSSPAAFTALKSPLSCYKLNFAAVTLSNAFVLSPNSTLEDLFAQARFAISDRRTADMLAIADIFRLLNGNDPLGRCGR
ncbi:MAG: Ig-like domain-containing protein [Acidobacteriota bacterium]|nr:Ig-like domain-containing protein [Acidobacteriota bacterium]